MKGGRALRLAGPIFLAAFAAACGRDPREPFVTDVGTIPEAYRVSTAALGWPGATRAFQVTPAGDLWNGEWRARFAAWSGSVPADSPRTIAFEERWRPVAHWVRRSGDVEWRFEATALPELEPLSWWRRLLTRPEAARDSGLVVTLAVRARHLGATPVDVHLECTLDPGDPAPPFSAFDAPEKDTGPPRWAAGGVELAQGWSALPAAGASVRWSARLAPGETTIQRFVIPAYSTPGVTLERWARVPHVNRVEEARRAWERETTRGVRFELGDPEVEAAVRGALVVLLTCRERRGSMWLPIGSPFHYRDVWLRDGARATAALAMLGYGAEARAHAAGFLLYQWPVGAFVSQRGQLDGTGQALWTFEQALLRPKAADSLDRYVDAALAAWRWMERQRAFGGSSGWRFGAMFPAAEPRDNEATRAQLTGNDAWAIAGYRAVARLLRAAGRGAAADSVEASRRAYVADFRAALERSGSADVPPSWQGSGRDWGNLTVTYPCAVLPADHPRAMLLARRVWGAGSGPGLASYGHADSLHYYLGADLVMAGWLRGERAPADRVLDAMLEWRSASGGAGELFSRATRDFGPNLPPHATSAAALLSLVRNALVFDDGDTLALTLGARAAWWRGGAVRRAPTRWGTLDLEFSRRGSQAEWRWTPVPVWTALTLPPGTRLAAAPPAPLVRASRADQVLAPPGTRSARVAVADL